MEIFKINLLTIILFLLLIPLSQAETTFFDQDDSFIMSNSATSGVGGTTGGGSGGSSGGGSCLTNWTCSDWSFCNNGMQIRNCTKQKVYCYADLNKKPIESQNCFGDKSGEEINNFPEIKAIKNNRYLISGVIIVFISLVILGFVLYKMHRKRRYFSYGY